MFHVVALGNLPRRQEAFGALLLIVLAHGAVRNAVGLPEMPVAGIVEEAVQVFAVDEPLAIAAAWLSLMSPEPLVS